MSQSPEETALQFKQMWMLRCPGCNGFHWEYVEYLDDYRTTEDGLSLFKCFGDCGQFYVVEFSKIVP